MSAETRIAFVGSCDIHSATQQHADLLEALRNSDELRIDAEGAEYLDLSFMQLLIAASKTAATAGKRLRFERVSQAFKDGFARAGLKLSADQDQIVLP